MDIVFRPAIPRDASGLYKLNTAFNGPGKKTVQDMAENLKAPGNEWIFVACCNEEPIAFCCCQIIYSFCYEAPSVQLTELYVDPAFRRKNVARGLLELVEKRCRAQSVDSLTLLTGDDNLPARSFYEGCGFALSGELHYEKEF